MKITLTILFLFFTIVCPSYSQILPCEGSVLNYRLAGFSFPDIQDAASYTIEIAQGDLPDTEELFENNIIKVVSCTQKKLIIELPYWGMHYTWRVVFANKNSDKIKSPFHHFSTGKSVLVNADSVRLRVLKHSSKYKDAYVFSDN